MSKERMNVPWSEVLADDSPPASLVVIRPGGARGGGAVAGGWEGSQGDSKDVRDMTDKQLNDSIIRLQRTRMTSVHVRLPDSGAKLDARIRTLKEELERRKESGHIDDDEVAVNERRNPAESHLASSGPGKSPPASPPQELSKSCSHTPSRFASIFLKGLEKAENRSNTAFKQELSCMGRSNSTKKRNSTAVCGRGEKGKTSLKFHHFKHPNSLGSGRKGEHVNVDKFHKDKITNNSTLSPWSRPSCSSKGKAHEKQVAKKCKSDQVLEVVVLDEDVKPLPEKEQKNIGQGSNVKIYYPSRDHAECVELCHADLNCLDPESYLSSTIMNFYILYLQRRAFPFAKPRGDYHFFNTYFYRKLLDAIYSKDDKTARLTKLRRWFKGVNLFQKAYIFLPIHGSSHWSLVIVCIPAKEDATGPIVLHLDSLGLHGSEVIFGNIASYLKEEWIHVKGTACPHEIPMSDEIWHDLPNKIVRRIIMVPQQKNDYDCGLFVLYFMERFMEEAPERVRKEDLAKFDKWFEPDAASSLRRRIRELLLEEFESARVGDGLEESPSSSEGI